MSEEKKPGNPLDMETASQEKERRISERRELRKKQRQRALLLRLGLVLAAGLCLGGGAFLIYRHAEKIREEKERAKEEQQQADTEGMELVGIEDVLHLSFQSLIASTDAAFGQEDESMALAIDQGHLTVDEFNGVLEQLYEDGYMLIRLSDLIDTDASTGEIVQKELYLPQGKKPLIISEQNVSYDLDWSGCGLASRLVVEADGGVGCERDRADGGIDTGALDVVPCVDAFVEEHPDFSYENARGILGLTGYCGILGYRTEEALAVSEGNRYADQYGVFDTDAEIEEAQSVVEALLAEGWEFAYSGYAEDLSFSSDAEELQSDILLWKEKVGTLVGDTQIVLYPSGLDIGDASSYTEDNEFFSVLTEEGFQYFCSLDLGGSQGETGSDYVFLPYLNLDGYRMYRDLYEDAGRFAGILTFDGLYDTARPSAQTAGGTDG